jgi:hypothetical protein
MDVGPDEVSRREGGLPALFAAVRGRWLHLSPLARDLTVVLLAKAALLGLLWWAFFSAPTASHMTMDPQRVDSRLLRSPPPEAPRAQP